MIEVKNLTKRYGNHLAVDHLNFTVESGKIYGFLGPNGAGKIYDHEHHDRLPGSYRRTGADRRT